VLADTVEPQVEAVIRQQTPNPAAQFPSPDPPLDVHSVLVTQVPYVVDDEAVVQARLGKETIEKRENCLSALSPSVLLLARAMVSLGNSQHSRTTELKRMMLLAIVMELNLIQVA